MAARKSHRSRPSKADSMVGKSQESTNVSATKTRSGKLAVQSPSSIGKFLVVLLMHICRKVLLVNTNWKVAIYIVGVMAGSLVTDVFPFPPSYFSNKKNLFNVYFVKLGWGWTLTLLLPYVILTSFVLCYGNWRNVFMYHVSRLGYATIAWYVLTSLFAYIEHISGVCSSGLTEEHSTKALCVRADHTWIAIDISGHCFLLVLSLLTISEEVKSIFQWERIEEFISKEEIRQSGKLSTEELTIVKSSYYKYTPSIRCFVVLLTILQCLWEIMLLCTTIYFHNMPQKVIGVLSAALVWFILYYILCKSSSSFLPVRPGKSPLKPKV